LIVNVVIITHTVLYHRLIGRVNRNLRCQLAGRCKVSGLRFSRSERSRTGIEIGLTNRARVGVSWTIGLTNRDDRFLYHMVYLSAIVNVEMIEVTRMVYQMVYWLHYMV
jgi:hypothetical protein